MAKAVALTCFVRLHVPLHVVVMGCRSGANVVAYKKKMLRKTLEAPENKDARVSSFETGSLIINMVFSSMAILALILCDGNVKKELNVGAMVDKGPMSRRLMMEELVTLIHGN